LRRMAAKGSGLNFKLNGESLNRGFLLRPVENRQDYGGRESPSHIKPVIIFFALFQSEERVDRGSCICNNICMYEIRFAEGVKDDLKRIPAHYRSIILGQIELHLSQAPDQESRRKKMLPSLVPEFESAPPVWQLRVGEFRVFYDIDPDRKIVHVRLVRKKPAHRTTEEIL